MNMKERRMTPSDDKEDTTPTEARGAVKSGIVWKILIISLVLAVIAMIVIGQGTETPTG